MSALKKYIDETNHFYRFFPKYPKLAINSREERQKVADHISSALSPENLYCDGEISHASAASKYRKLASAMKELQRLDPGVKFLY